MLWVLGFYIVIKKEIFKNLLVPNCKGQSFHIWHVASSSGLYQNTLNYGLGVEISPMLWVLGFYIEIKKEIFKNLLVPNRKGKSFDIWHVASSSGPLPKFQIMALEGKLVLCCGFSDFK